MIIYLSWLVADSFAFVSLDWVESLISTFLK